MAVVRIGQTFCERSGIDQAFCKSGQNWSDFLWKRVRLVRLLWEGWDWSGFLGLLVGFVRLSVRGLGLIRLFIGEGGICQTFFKRVWDWSDFQWK